MEEVKLLEMIRGTSGRTREALDAILQFRRGEVSENRMIFKVTENRRQVFAAINKFFFCRDSVGAAKVLNQLVYSHGNNTLNTLRPIGY